MVLAEALVKLTGDASSLEGALNKADKGLEKTEQQAKSTQDSMKKLSSTAKDLATIFTTYVVAGVAYMANEFMDAEEAAFDLKNSLKNIGIESQEANDQLIAMANTLEKTTGYADDQLVSAMDMLIQTTKDYNVALKYTGAVADFAAAKKMDLTSAANILGRAYVNGGESLKRYGVNLKETAKGIEVLDAVSKQFAGTAATKMETLRGQLKGLTNDFNNAAEAGGGGLVPLLSEMISLARNAIPFWTKFGEEVGKFFKLLYNNPIIKTFTLPLKYLTDVILPGLLYSFGQVFDSISKALKGDFGGAVKAITLDVADMNIMLNQEFGRNVKKMFTETAVAADGAKKAIGGSNGIGAVMQQQAEDVESAGDAIQATMDGIKADGEAMAAGISTSFKAMGAALVETHWNIAEGFKAAGKAGLVAVLDALQKRAEAELALFTAEALIPGMQGNIPGIAALAAAIGGLEAIKAGVNAMAEGGILTRPALTTFAENGPEAAIPLNKLEPLIANAMNRASTTTNNSHNTIVIKAPKIDNNTNFDAVARNMDKALTKLNKQRGV